MSEPISAEELARLREEFKDTPRDYLPAWPVPALLDKIDSLTEALHATDEQIEELVAIEAAHKRCAADLADCRAGWLEDLADEKRRHAELRAAVDGLAGDCRCRWTDNGPYDNGEHRITDRCFAHGEAFADFRARLRTLAENREQIFPSQVLSLLDEVDRLTEALEAMTGFRDECERQYQVAIHAQGRAEADLVAKDEQIECLVADRKTEHDGRHRAEQALAAMTAERDMLDRIASGYQADLAVKTEHAMVLWDEKEGWKRRHAELRAGVEALTAKAENAIPPDALELMPELADSVLVKPSDLRALLDTATEETGTL